MVKQYHTNLVLHLLRKGDDKLNLIESLVSGIILLIWGSMEYRMRKVREDVNKKIDRREATDLIDLKQEALKISHDDIKKNIEKVEKKIDMLIDLQIKSDK